MYALKQKNRFVFLCAAPTQKKHEEKVERAYRAWLGMQPRGSTSSIDDFLSGYERVKITLEPYNALPNG